MPGKEKMSRTEPFIHYENTIPGVFIRRVNRFVAEVLIEGNAEKVHVKNTGRLKELLVPKARVTLQKSSNPDRKTAYDLISVYEPELKWVNIDSLAPNELMRQQLMGMGYDVVRPEYTYGGSRFDFYMERARTASARIKEERARYSRTRCDTGEKYLTEVKGCTLASDLERGIGLFPDAPTERGVKHLEELAEAARKGFHCQIAFVIQMNGIHMVFPNDGTHPKFGQALIRAAKAGVKVVYYSCQVEADSIRITGMMDDTERYAE